MFSCLFSVDIYPLLTLVQLTATPIQLGRTKLFIILLKFIILSTLVICLLINPVLCEQYLIIPVFSIHDLSHCVNGIFSLVTFNYFIHDSGNIDILRFSFHDIPEFSLCDPLHLFLEIYSKNILSHNICRVSFNPNTLNINVFILYHVHHKIVTNINVLGMYNNLPILF